MIFKTKIKIFGLSIEVQFGIEQRWGYLNFLVIYVSWRLGVLRDGRGMTREPWKNV
jgi:hypothetical protein